jgi:double-stranded uracil-DNA glycosylase
VPRFTRAELEAYAGAVIPDLLDGRVKLLFVGINPGLWTAAV